MGLLVKFAALLCLLAGILLSDVFAPEFVVHKSGAILLTGASSGIGYDAAITLASLGYTVFGTVRKETDGEGLKKSGVIPIIMDVRNEDSVDAAVETISKWILENKQPFVALVNNAGVSFSMPVEFAPLDKARNLFEINLFGLIYTTQAFLPLLRTHKARMISVGSVAGLIAAPGHGIYSASKHAVEAICDSLRVELRPHGVSVSLVEPGYVQTAIVEKSLAPEAPFRQITPAQHEAYAYFFDHYEDQRRLAFSAAPYPNTTTTPAIVDAIRSAQPAARYVVAGVGVMPAWVAVRLLRVLPVWLRDLVLAKSFYSAKAQP